MFTLADIGLLFDIAGAVMLAQGLVLESLGDLARNRIRFWGAHDRISSTTTQQVIEGRSGLGLLILGFIGQILGSHIQIKVDAGFFWFVAILLIGCCLAVHHFAVSYAKRHVKQDSLST